MANRIPRFQIMARDDFRCIYCGATPLTTELHIDHVIPKSRGGTDDTWNLATSCIPCNLSKSNSLPTEGIVKTIRLRETEWRRLRENSNYAACMWCGKPVLLVVGEDQTADCETCNNAASSGYRIGRQR